MSYTVTYTQVNTQETHTVVLPEGKSFDILVASICQSPEFVLTSVAPVAS